MKLIYQRKIGRWRWLISIQFVKAWGLHFIVVLFIGRWFNKINWKNIHCFKSSQSYSNDNFPSYLSWGSAPAPLLRYFCNPSVFCMAWSPLLPWPHALISMLSFLNHAVVTILSKQEIWTIGRNGWSLLLSVLWVPSRAKLRPTKNLPQPVFNVQSSRQTCFPTSSSSCWTFLSSLFNSLGVSTDTRHTIFTFKWQARWSVMRCLRNPRPAEKSTNNGGHLLYLGQKLIVQNNQCIKNKSCLGIAKDIGRRHHFLNAAHRVNVSPKSILSKLKSTFN